MEEQIKKWKEEFKYVYKIMLAGKDYYFRTLTRKDYFEILAKQSEPEFDNDAEVVKRCILSTLDEDEIDNKAGIATILSEKIMTLSGFETSEPEAL